MTMDTVNHGCAKHIDIKFYFLLEKVEDGVIDLEYKPAHEMISDGLTKALGRTKHALFCEF